MVFVLEVAGHATSDLGGSWLRSGARRGARSRQSIARPTASSSAVELAPSCTARDATRKAQELSPDRLGYEQAADLEPERGEPADEVVGDRRAHRPGAIGTKAPRGAVRKSRSLFQVSDRELDDRMAPVVCAEVADGQPGAFLTQHPARTYDGGNEGDSGTVGEMRCRRRVQHDEVAA